MTPQRMKHLAIGLVAALSVHTITVAGMVDWMNGVTVGAQLPEAGLSYLGATPTLAGQVVLVDFWATWCQPCRESIPRLNDWHARFASKGLVIVGVSNEPREVVLPFLARLPMAYPSAVEGSPSWHQQLGIKALPYAIFVGRSGKILWRGQPHDITDELIDAMLAR